MSRLLAHGLLIVLIFLPFLSLAEPSALRLKSGIAVPTVIELYTSEGCSSCPPADEWLSSLQRTPRLFEQIIPMAFHVDYWDGLGWQDRFASDQFSVRQRRFVREGLSQQVYTPGFMVNSKEWRGWFTGRRELPQSTRKSGVLEVSWSAADSFLTYHFTAPLRASWELNIAYLGMGLCSEVMAGENLGRSLCHDFVVLKHVQQPMAGGHTGRYEGSLKLPARPQRGQSRTALVAWVSQEGTVVIEQAVAGYLPEP